MFFFFFLFFFFQHLELGKASTDDVILQYLGLDLVNIYA